MSDALIYKKINGYDPKMPLTDIQKELFCHEIIKQYGNKKRAWEIIYNEGKPVSRNKANAPYNLFNGKQLNARYHYLSEKYLKHAGIDSNSLLLKTSKLINKAVDENNVSDFKSLVDTVLKLKGNNPNKSLTITNNIEVTKDDLANLDSFLKDNI